MKSGKARSKTQDTQNRTLRCFKCNEPRHFAKSCRNAHSAGLKRCGICKKTNHNEKIAISRKLKNIQIKKMTTKFLFWSETRRN